MTIHLPYWAAWTIGTIVVFAVLSLLFKGDGGGDYGFDPRPLIGILLFFAWLTFIAGILLARGCR